MLTQHVTSPISLSRLQATACSPYLDGYTDWLAAKHYASSTIELFLFGILPLGHWLETNDLSITEFDHHALDLFGHERATLGKRYHRSGKQKAAFRGAMCFYEYLVANGVVEPKPDISKRCELLVGFEQWMVCHKGVRQATLANHMYYLKPFIVTMGDKPELYCAKAVRRHLRQVSTSSQVPTIQAASTSIRTFLRYLVATGQCSNTLVGAVPKIAYWSLSTLPRSISPDDIEQLIDSCSMTTLTARRDRAVLLLLARLALRAGDVAALELTDIDWREGRIRVAGKNRREFWLPMPQDVGDALVDYIQNERPNSREQRVILKCIAPMRPANRTLISSIVRRAINRTGMDTPSAGAHLLRHSAATAMLAQGATLAQIGSVLRHSSINTTAIYAKVDTNLLNGVAAPWPSPDDEQQGEIVPMTGAGSC